MFIMQVHAMIQCMHDMYEVCLKAQGYLATNMQLNVIVIVGARDLEAN